MKFYERVISDFGGYEKCKDILSQPNIDLIMNAQGLREHMLEYRHQHNIFEVGDKVVSINSAFIEYQGVLNIDFINKFNLMLSDDSKGFEVNAICGWSKIIRHATDEEIKAGKRLEVE
ncbi:hypothetical protein [Acinetobacter sp. YH12025]|uniref:hypothetical protein n=1 Tax=Acinetobacter sp. YH12025 TaxID=2601042 RepID=UPI0015D2439E|nr:hypothetical protein [Acinetobacter sp. YH12025]